MKKRRVVWVILTFAFVYISIAYLINVQIDLPIGDDASLETRRQSDHEQKRPQTWVENTNFYKLFKRKANRKSLENSKQGFGVINGLFNKFPINFRQMRQDNVSDIYQNFTQNAISRNNKASGSKSIVSAQRPVEHISYLKVHMMGSTPLQLMLFRFGHVRNLSFVVPVQGHYFTKSTGRHEPILPPKHGGHYDIISNHACFNFSLYSSLMPKDTKYIAIVMNPYEQFVQSFYYYSRFFTFGYLKKIPEPKIENLIKYPQKYDESCLSYTMNSMARDFGFQKSHFDDLSMKEAKEYLQSIIGVFDLVLIFERYDESVILLKRLLHWDLKSVLYLPDKVDTPESNLVPELMAAFRVRNRLDYLLYDYFAKVMDQKIKDGGRRLREETLNFRLVQRTVRLWCFEVYWGRLVVPATQWNDRFEISARDCDLMEMSEFQYLEMFRRQSQV